MRIWFLLVFLELIPYISIKAAAIATDHRDDSVHSGVGAAPITYFKVQYTRGENFSLESIEREFAGTAVGPLAELTILKDVLDEKEITFLRSITEDQLKEGLSNVDKFPYYLIAIKRGYADIIQHLEDEYYSEGNNDGRMALLLLEAVSGDLKEACSARIQVGKCYNNIDYLPAFLKEGRDKAELEARKIFWYQAAKKCGDSEIIGEVQVYLGEAPDLREE